MATKKRKTSASKKMVAKTKKSLPKKTRKVNNQIKSFRISREKYPFFTFRITEQTVYWSILLILILLLSLWVLNIQISINELLNEIKAAVV